MQPYTFIDIFMPFIDDRFGMKRIMLIFAKN